MNIEMALKSRSYILDLDHVKLSLGIFFCLSCLIKSFVHQLLAFTFIFVKSTHQKAANLTFYLILPAAMVFWWFLGVQYMYCNELLIQFMYIGCIMLCTFTYFCIFHILLCTSVYCNAFWVLFYILP